MQNTQPKLSKREIAEAWATITTQLCRNNLTRIKIGKNSSGGFSRRRAGLHSLNKFGFPKNYTYLWR